MSKTVTVSQLRRAFAKAPREVEREGKIFLQRGLSEYKRVALQTSPWRIGQSGGGIPRSSGNLREKHRTVISRLEGKFGVEPSHVRYANYVHGGTRRMEARPWLDFAKMRGDKQVEKHYRVFMDNILSFIAT